METKARDVGNGGPNFWNDIRTGGFPLFAHLFMKHCAPKVPDYTSQKTERRQVRWVPGSL